MEGVWIVSCCARAALGALAALWLLRLTLSRLRRRVAAASDTLPRSQRSEHTVQQLSKEALLASHLLTSQRSKGPTAEDYAPGPCIEAAATGCWRRGEVRLDSGWRAKRASELGPGGAAALTSPAQPTFTAGEGWLAATVPGTALGTLVAAGQLPDPYQGLNNDLIPDVYHTGPEQYTFTWCTPFAAPGGWAAAAGGRAWLHLGGANYSIAVHLNGGAVAVPQPAGMFLRRRLDVTEHLTAPPPGGLHRLAVTVAPPDPPGCVDRGGQGGDHLLARSVTAQFLGGWDWAQPVRDRGTGLWGAAAVRFTGPVALSDPHIVVSPGGGVVSGAAGLEEEEAEEAWSARLAQQAAALGRSAALAASVVATNGGAEPCLVRLRCSVAFLGSRQEGWGQRAEKLRWEEDHRLEAGASRLLRLALPAGLHLPHLWWPLNLGPQPLYELRVEAYCLEAGGGGGDRSNGSAGSSRGGARRVESPPAAGALSDALSERFGVRSVGSGVDPRLGGHAFFVNGERVFVRGGNWIAADAMLRCAPGRCRREVRLHADAGLNMIRLWGGGGCTPPEFYAACDEAGVLVWQEFWITGDCNGRGATPDSPLSDASWPDDHSLFYACARDTIKALRNHPSLVLWCGGNEQTPAPDLCAALTATLPAAPIFPPRPGGTAAVAGGHEALLLRALQDAPQGEGAALDATRLFVPGSLWAGFGAGDGTFSDGPYGIQEPSAFFRPDFYPHAFNPEVGSVGVPVAESVLATFPDPEHARPPRFEARAGQEVPNAAWQRHCYLPYYGAAPGGEEAAGPSGRPEGEAGQQPPPQRQQQQYHALAQYHLPEDVHRFCDLAQVANYEQYKALCEGWGSGMWSRFSGMLVWKSQAPWPGLRGQLYDWYLEETGGYWGAKAALQPLHVQLNLASMRVEIVNATTQPHHGATVKVEVYSLWGLPHHRRHTDSGGAPAEEEEPLLEGKAGQRCLEAAASGLDFPRFVEGDFSDVPARRTTSGFRLKVPWHKLPGGVCVVRLSLLPGRHRHRPVSRNLYWLCDPGGGDFRSLVHWCREGGHAQVGVHVGKPEACRRGEEPGVSYSLRLHNRDSHRVAFWVRLRVVWEPAGAESSDGDTGPDAALLGSHTALCSHRHRLEGCPRLLPTYSDNYLTLVPKEEMEVSLTLPAAEAPPAGAEGGRAWLLVKGWNVPFRAIPLAGFARGHS